MSNVNKVDTDTDGLKNLLSRHTTGKEPDSQSAVDKLSKAVNETDEAHPPHKKQKQSILPTKTEYDVNESQIGSFNNKEERRSMNQQFRSFIYQQLRIH